MVDRWRHATLAMLTSALVINGLGWGGLGSGSRVFDEAGEPMVDVLVAAPKLFLESLVSAAIRVAIAEGERKVQDYRIR